MKSKKACDDAGVVAELLKFAPEEFLAELLVLYNQTLRDGIVPETWRATTFIMLAKKTKAKCTADFRPVACLRILYKLYAYLLLGRIETTLDAAQPEEQHGFRSGRRIEEHLLTASLVIERTLAVAMPIWIISLDLSKAFDRVDWPALWRALADQGVSPHIIWNLQCAYYEQLGQVRGDSVDSRSFEILGGVRQGCVLSARLFTAVLQWAMSRWREKVRGHGINLEDGGDNLIDLRFADDLLLFAKTAAEASWLLDTLVVELGAVGLILNAKKLLRNVGGSASSLPRNTRWY